jgi:hypothetical protein
LINFHGGESSLESFHKSTWESSLGC